MPSKKFILIIIINFFSFISKAQEQKRIWLINVGEFQSVSGNVKQLIISYSDNTTLSNDDITVSIDRSSNVIKTISDVRGSYSQDTYITKYGLNGIKLETRCYSALLNHEPIIPTDPSYWNNGKTIKSDTIKKITGFYKYDHHNNIIKFISNSIDTLRNVEEYKYNSDGDLIESNYYHNSTQIINSTKYKYNKNHLLTESNDFHSNRLLSKKIYEYLAFDSQNNWIKAVVHSTNILEGPEINSIIITRAISYY